MEGEKCPLAEIVEIAKKTKVQFEKCFFFGEKKNIF